MLLEITGRERLLLQMSVDLALHDLMITERMYTRTSEGLDYFRAKVDDLQKLLDRLDGNDCKEVTHA